MIEEIFTYAITAVLASFAWLILTGYRPQGESRSTGIRHLAIVLLVSALIYFIWRRDLGLTALFSIDTLRFVGSCGIDCRIGTAGHALLAAFAVVLLYSWGVFWAILLEICCHMWSSVL
jgi:hypothetical protein